MISLEDIEESLKRMRVDYSGLVAIIKDKPIESFETAHLLKALCNLTITLLEAQQRTLLELNEIKTMLNSQK